jgi:pSer/pThr/pTyr-binding forkhead associated (FHA) protein
MKSFLNACGISQPLQIAVGAPTANETGVRLLHQPFALIGRDQRADVPLDHKLVSRRHVYLQVVEGQAFWIDLESRTGTLGEGQLRKFGWLEAGKVIGIGPYELQRLIDGSWTQDGGAPQALPDTTPLVARSYGRQPLPTIGLEFLNGPSRSVSWPLNRVMSLIGSASGCKFRLADPSVSSFHCSLLRTPLGLWVVDLLGRDGIDVNNVLIRCALLADGDVLRVGRYRIRIRSQFAGRDNGPDSSQGWHAMVHTPQRWQAALSQPLSVRNTCADAVASKPTARSEPPARSRTPFASAMQVPSVEWAPLAPCYPVELEKTGLPESLLVPLVNQFGLMQQQMLDQFQQAMSMLVQMFGTLHQDQMDLIREELDQLHDLTKEFHALKLELATLSRNQAQIASAKAAGSPVNPEELMAGSRDTLMESAPEAGTKPVAVPISPPTPDSPVSPPAANAPDALRSSPVSLTTSGLDRPDVLTPQEQTLPGRPTPPLASDRDVIVWLHQRITTLQNERESRWQKILKLLPGFS